MSVDVLLNNRLSLNNTTNIGSGSLIDVLLDVVDDLLVNLTVNNGLNVNNLVLADSLLYDGLAANK